GTTDTPMFYVDNVAFKEIVPATDVLTGYDVFLDGTQLNTALVTDEFYQFTGLNVGQTYLGGVRAVYINPAGVSIIETDEFTYTPPPVLPPTNLVAVVQDYNEVLLTWEAPSGQPTALWDQMSSPGADGGISAQDFEASYNQYDAEGADDFVVPTGATWTISEVDVLGTYSVAGPCDLANVRIYANNAGIPGTLLFEYLNVPATPSVEGNLFCVIPNTTLTAGTYWMSVQGRMDYATGGQWYWSRQSPPTIGYEFQWQNPGGGFGGLTSWGAGSIQWPGQTCYDLSFVIYGIATDGGVTTVYAGPDRGIENNGITKAEKRVSRNVVSRAPTISTSIVGNSHGTQIENSRSLAGYNVYRDGGVIAAINSPILLTYLDDSGLDAGTYDYHVTAVYTNPDDESGPSNTETVAITLPAPTGVTAETIATFHIRVQWNTMDDSRGVESYNIYRDGNTTPIGTSTSNFYLDLNMPTGEYIYNVAAVFTGGYEGTWSANAPISHVGTDDILVPLVTSLDGNYPNPFNPTTMIKFGLHEDQKVSINVYNIKGEKVRTLVNGELEAGYHSILWNGRDDSGKTTASGVYFYKMKAGKFVSTKKMILMK
ncbi:MAG: FlgD immunoglobulin-like domain containing protein, partial [Candidatus Cloacimonadales bacterium]|nr:FlgD immunoglobulin-like domain containing protein [Candidatus Cloacimonadales bacterium]